MFKTKMEHLEHGGKLMPHFENQYIDPAAKTIG
ncbi:MAG: hypothetical protein JWP81_3842 [Ferruginibacter sp.]|nr:hypothetical protein [Ferruginibacter sp.]